MRAGEKESNTWRARDLAVHACPPRALKDLDVAHGSVGLEDGDEGGACCDIVCCHGHEGCRLECQVGREHERR
jgi:hypothetical protein